MPETPGMPSLERRKLRAGKGVAVRLGKINEAPRLDTEIRMARLAEHIAKIVNEAPPLTIAQKDRLAELLSGAR